MVASGMPGSLTLQVKYAFQMVRLRKQIDQVAPFDLISGAVSEREIVYTTRELSRALTGYPPRYSALAPGKCNNSRNRRRKSFDRLQDLRGRPRIRFGRTMRVNQKRFILIFRKQFYFLKPLQWFCAVAQSPKQPNGFIDQRRADRALLNREQFVRIKSVISD